MDGYQIRLNNLREEKEVACIDCSTIFVSNNIQTKRCDDCKTKPLKRTFTRNCCNCGKEFTSRNIYTVTCSQKCGHAAQGGLANRAKRVIKLRTFIKRQSKRISKEGYQATIMTPEKLLDDCRATWGVGYTYKVPAKASGRPLVKVICTEHGKSSFVYNRYEKPSHPCKYCRECPSTGVFTEGLLARDAELAATPYKVYLLLGNDFNKIGLTAQDCKTDRVKRLISGGGFVGSKITYEGTLAECFELEQFILQEADNHQPEKKFGGHTECFTSNNVHISEGLL